LDSNRTRYGAPLRMTPSRSPTR